MYSHTWGTVLSEVASVVYCGVTTDLWQSQTQNRTYISLYLHAVNCNSASGFSMINRCLKTFEVQEDNTAENITQAMYETFVQWGITHKVNGATVHWLSRHRQSLFAPGAFCGNALPWAHHQSRNG